MEIVFARHGESEANLLREISNRGYKHGLTDRGRQQAAALAERLGDRAVTQVYASPLLRAVQTAEIVASAWQAPLVIRDALREYDCGTLEGRSDEASWACYEELWRAWIEEGQWDRRMAGGESFQEIRARFVPFVEGLIEAHRDRAGSLVLVGHGGLYRCTLPLVLANVDWDFVLAAPLGYTGYAVARVQEDGLVCSAWYPTAEAVATIPGAQEQGG